MIVPKVYWRVCWTIYQIFCHLSNILLLSNIFETRDLSLVYDLLIIIFQINLNGTHNIVFPNKILIYQESSACGQFSTYQRMLSFINMNFMLDLTFFFKSDHEMF